MEALRYLPYLNKDGWLVTNTKPYTNIPSYPEMEKVMAELNKLPHKVLLDVETVAKEIGLFQAPLALIVCGTIQLGGHLIIQCGCEFFIDAHGVRV